jgi:hypothetical protein
MKKHWRNFLTIGYASSARASTIVFMAEVRFQTGGARNSFIAIGVSIKTRSEKTETMIDAACSQL